MLKRYIKQHLEKVFGVRVLFVWEKISSFFFYSWIFFFAQEEVGKDIYRGNNNKREKKRGRDR